MPAKLDQNPGEFWANMGRLASKQDRVALRFVSP
jgi:hypothetical protein